MALIGRTAVTFIVSGVKLNTSRQKDFATLFTRYPLVGNFLLRILFSLYLLLRFGLVLY